MNHYYIIAEIEEGYPNYNFIIKADTRIQASEIARDIVLSDYPDFDLFTKHIDCNEVTPDELIRIMTIN